jgi:DNA-binding IscR family transcriptional regulator
MNNARTKLQHETRQIKVRKIINAITDNSTTTLCHNRQQHNHARRNTATYAISICLQPAAILCPARRRRSRR